MTYFFNVLLFVMNVVVSSAQADPAVSSAAPIRVLFLGDSLTEGYGVAREQAFPALVEKRFHGDGKTHIQVVNAGIGGSTSASAVARLRWHLKNKPQAMFLCLGANDGLRGVDLKTTEAHLQTVIDLAKSQRIHRIFLGGMLLPLNYGEAYRKDFQNMYERLANKNELRLIPFILDGVGGVATMNLADGIHPNEKGHERVAENVYRVMKDQL